MFDKHRFGGDRSSWSYLIAVLLTAFLIAAGPVFGQLTDQDIEEMRQRAKVEGWTFTVGRTPVSNYSLEQLCPPFDEEPYVDDSRFRPIVSLPPERLPDRFDWRDTTELTPVKEQGSCGSCWAFAAVGTVESAIKLTDGVEEDLSEQWVVSCNTIGGGCLGGDTPFDHFVDRGDICGDPGCPLESVFPYVADKVPCGCPYPGERYFIDDWWYIGLPHSFPSVEEIKTAILQYGPVKCKVYHSVEMNAYTGGVWNYCETEPTNHLVVLVGWDDNLGTEGVWILRNSFGAWWGEDGYMLIEYGCNRIGELTCCIEYSGPIQISAEPPAGEVALDVQFSAITGLVDATNWQWDFGDGSTGTGENPFHTYQDVGVYDVTATVDTYEGVRSSTRERLIVVHADTIKADSVRCQPDTKVEIELTANNIIPVNFLRVPVEFPSDCSIAFDSVSTVGCRTEYFEIQEYQHYDISFGRRFTYDLTASETGTSPDLAPGGGPVLKVHFTIPASAPYGGSAQIVLDGYLDYFSTYGYRRAPGGLRAFYSPTTVAGEIVVGESCCLLAGDVDQSGEVDIADLHYLRDYLHSDVADLPCFDAADVNGDGLLTQEDLSCIARYLHSTGNACVFVPCE